MSIFPCNQEIFQRENYTCSLHNFLPANLLNIALNIVLCNPCACTDRCAASSCIASLWPCWVVRECPSTDCWRWLARSSSIIICSKSTGRYGSASIASTSSLPLPKVCDRTVSVQLTYKQMATTRTQIRVF